MTPLRRRNALSFGETRRNPIKLWPTATRPFGSIREITLPMKVAPQDQAEQETNRRSDAQTARKALQLDPQSAVAYTRRGSVLAIMHEYDKAIADFEHAIRLDPVQSFPRFARLCVDGEERIHQGI